MYELVGYRRVDIEAERKNDRDTHGTSCYFLVEENDKEFVGRSAVKVYFSDENYPDFHNQVLDGEIKLGDKFLLIFNQKGKLQAYQKLDG